MRRTVNADNGGPSPPLSAKHRDSLAVGRLALTQETMVRFPLPVPTSGTQEASRRPAKSVYRVRFPAHSLNAHVVER